ncbi:endospore germination permease [Wukongibacter baidiensis]|uniref:GerAB/ArcD/ProY family transporter n=1 Tax=Wukongibacter baidiensis TaxID=1723361 RepID=UPI003D7F3169
MKKEVISEKQGISLIVMFILGSSVIEVSGLEAGKDFWIAIILAILMAIPLVLIYARILSIFPGNNLFDIIEICFGKFIGKGVMIIFTLFIFEEGAELLRNIGHFIVSSSLTESSLVMVMLYIVILSIWVAKLGIEVLARWGEFFLIILITFVFFSILLLTPDMNIINVLPVFDEGIKPIITGAYEVFIFPFAQTFTFTMIFYNYKKKSFSYRVYIPGLLIGGALLFAISVNGLLVLGIDEASNAYYASYEAIKRMNIGGFVQRIEIIIATIFILGGFVKASIYLLATTAGVSKIFGTADYRFIVIPIGALMLNLAHLEFDNMIHYFRFADVWYFYVTPFLVILPIIIWIIAEIKGKRLSKGKNE